VASSTGEAFLPDPVESLYYLKHNMEKTNNPIPDLDECCWKVSAFLNSIFSCRDHFEYEESFVEMLSFQSLFISLIDLHFFFSILRNVKLW
jgi:hypothetical protein